MAHETFRRETTTTHDYDLRKLSGFLDIYIHINIFKQSFLTFIFFSREMQGQFKYEDKSIRSRFFFHVVLTS